jgi:hypothetical protein
MTYVEARRIEQLIKDYRQLALDYWAAVQQINYVHDAWMAGAVAPTHSRSMRRNLLVSESGPSCRKSSTAPRRLASASPDRVSLLPLSARPRALV